MNNKEYLIAVFRHWPLSCKHVLSEHFAENGVTLWCTDAKLWCLKLCAIFSGTPCINCNGILQTLNRYNANRSVASTANRNCTAHWDLSYFIKHQVPTAILRPGIHSACKCSPFSTIQATFQEKFFHTLRKLPQRQISWDSYRFV